MHSISLALISVILSLAKSITALFSEAETIFQRPISPPPPHTATDDFSTASVSPALFTDIERLARLVDITYCVGTSGISQPFNCVSRCKEFPHLHLASTWNTGVLLTDSCGYVAIDHGSTGEEDDQVAAGHPAIIVAFRGTYSLANTVVDLSTVPQEYVPYRDPGEGGGGDGDGDGDDDDDGTEQHKCANCTVHMGFMESWRQARKLVLPVLQNARFNHPDYPIHVVGHSLGGAVACLAALELRLALGWHDLTVTTFGEPQAGNAGFAAFVDAVFNLVPTEQQQDEKVGLLEKRRYRRVTHVGDPVPLLPLSEWGYRPHGGEVFITKPQLSPGLEDLRMCSGDEDPSCIAGSDEGLLGIPSRLRLWQLLFAHRDYFWRLGLCVPGGDPSDWGRAPYNVSEGRLDEL
ncbi:unnamed protein product [Discula destructiva]